MLGLRIDNIGVLWINRRIEPIAAGDNKPVGVDNTMTGFRAGGPALSGVVLCPPIDIVEWQIISTATL